MSDSIKERLLAKIKVNEETQCWEWQKSKNRCGYGMMSVNNKQQTAHRLSYRVHHGEIENGLCVCHRCDNPSCINPDHLFLGTRKQNSEDMVRKKRSFKNCGSVNGKALLDENAVILIKKFLQRHPDVNSTKQGGQCTFLGKWFGVSPETISSIHHKRSWQHITVV